MIAEKGLTLIVGQWEDQGKHVSKMYSGGIVILQGVCDISTKTEDIATDAMS